MINKGKSPAKRLLKARVLLKADAGARGEGWSDGRIVEALDTNISHDPHRPLVCLDETSKQLVAETRMPLPMKPGQPERADYEYERGGTANLFMLFAPLEGFRHIEVTARRAAIDYAHVLRDLSDVHFPGAKTIVLVQDNLNTHAKASLYEAFAPAEARAAR